MGQKFYCDTWSLFSTIYFSNFFPPLLRRQLIAKSLPLDEIHGLRQMFLELDADRSGTVSLAELRRVLEAKGVAGAELTDELLGHLVKVGREQGCGGAVARGQHNS